MDPRIALLVADRLSRGAARRGYAAPDDRLRQYSVRAARLPRLRTLRLPRRRGRGGQIARGQPQSRLVLGRQAQPDGRDGRAALLGSAAVDPRSGRGTGRGTAPGAGDPDHRGSRCPCSRRLDWLFTVAVSRRSFWHVKAPRPRKGAGVVSEPALDVRL